MIRYPYEIINVEKKYELPNNLVDEHNRYVELKLTDYETMQQPERNELNDLSELLYPYNICSGDWNKFQEITANLQKFITIDLVNYINESYFSMEDVRNEIDNSINIFKNGDLKTIIFEALKKWGGGDYLGKEMVPINQTIYNGETFSYSNNRGGLLRLSLYGFAGSWGSDDFIDLIVDGKAILKNESFTNYGIPTGEEGSYEMIIPFSNSVQITLTENMAEKYIFIKGFAYLNLASL